MDLEYGEVLVAKWFWRSYPLHYYGFRCDPVPFVSKSGRFKNYFGSYYKRPKTTQERRLSFASPDFVRDKRNFTNLPNVWDDYQRSDIRNRKCWKRNKVKKQWMKHISK